MSRQPRARSISVVLAIAVCASGTGLADEPPPAPPAADEQPAPSGPPAPAPDEPTAPSKEPAPSQTSPTSSDPAAPSEPAPPPSEPTPPSSTGGTGPGAPTADAAASAAVEGTIIDNNTKLGLPAATIQVKAAPGGAGLDQTAVAELDGTYKVALAPGTYTIVYSTPEYVEQTRTVTVGAGERLELHLNLDPVPASAAQETIEIVDRIDTRKESAALAVRRAAGTVSDALSSQEIARTPDSNAGDAMKRVVAVSVIEGKYVALRGLEGRYVTAQLNGVLLPTPEPDRNAVPLDLFPTALLSTLTVIKSYSAELPGQFGGGTLSIDTHSFPTSLELRFGLSTSANTTSTLRDGLSNAHAGGVRSFLGFDSGERRLPSAIPRDRPVRNMDAAQMERIGESLPNVWTPRADMVTPNLGLTATVGNTTMIAGKRVGYLASGLFRRSFNVREGRSATVTMSGAGLEESDHLDFGVGVAESSLGALVNAGVDLSPNNEITVLGLYSHVGEDVSQAASGFVALDGADIDVTRLSYVTRGLGFVQLHGKHLIDRSRGVELRWQGNVASTTRDELDTRDLTYSKDPSGARTYRDQPGSGQHFWQSLSDLSGGGAGDARVRLGPVQLRAGTVAQLSRRDLEGRRFRLRFIGSDPMVRSLPAEQMFAAENIGPEFQLEEATLQEDAYEARLDTYAAYLTSEIEIHPKLRAILGARYERATQKMSNGSAYGLGGMTASFERDDSDVLPAANLVVSPRRDMNVRLAYSYTLTRPRFRELAPFLFFDYLRRRSISGNAGLVTTHIHNADLRWEWFPSENEVVAASVFGKQFIDPIEQVTVNINGDASFLNADGGNLIGAEIEARTNLGRLSPALRALRVGTNLAVMRSRVELGAEHQLLTNQSRPLYGQSPFIVNVSLGYADPRIADLNLLYNVIGARITDVGTSGLPDTREHPVHRVDAVATRALGRDLKIKLSVSNLLNQKIELRDEDHVVNTYAPGVSVSLGLDWTP